MAKAWITALGGAFISMVILYLAGFMGDNPFIGFPMFAISFAVLAYTGTLVKKLTA